MASRLPVVVRMSVIDGGSPPAFARPGDACADLRVTHDAELGPGDTATLWTGVRLELPEGYEAVVRGRSGLATRGLFVHVGTIDSGYRGQVGVVITNLGRDPQRFYRGDRCAQLAVRVAPHVAFTVVDSLSASSRGDSGFGSSGVR